MLSDIENLLHLQEADKEIRRLNEEVAALPKRVAAIEQRLAGTKAVLEKAKAAVKADEASRRKYETTITDLHGKISKYRDQSLAVKTNEQYKALLQEIQFAEQEIRANEDKILDLMVNAEAREKEVKAAEAELKEETAEIEKEKADARKRTAEDEAQLADWNGKRDKMRSGITEDVLRQYERVSKFRGSGLAEVRAQKCMGCQVMLRPQKYNEVKSGKDIVYCDSCQRVLYYDPATDQAEDPTVTVTKKRTRPKSDAPQAWFFRPDYAEEGEVLLVYQNESGMASRRIYDAHSGRQIGDILIREGNYRLAFPEDMTDSAIRLNGHWDPAVLEEWGTEMPTDALDALSADLRAAQIELRRTHKHDTHASATAEHPAAS